MYDPFGWRDPYDEPVQIQGHSHSEPICAWPDCATYLTREEMAKLQGWTWPTVEPEEAPA